MTTLAQMRPQAAFPQNENVPEPVMHRRLGKLPAKASSKTLRLSTFLKAGKPKLPRATNFWVGRKPFSTDTYGNTDHGCCTRASQAHLARRMERLEQKRTINFTQEEVLRVYYAMTGRLYGGGDTGAYEEDALSEWRKADLTIRDTSGRPHTIDAFTRVDSRSIVEMKTALYLAGAHGLKVCFNLPAIWANIDPPGVWDVRRNPDGQIDLTGDAMGGTWGGHSMMARDYDERGIWVPHTWGQPDQLVTWEGVMAYCDEAWVAIDSVNAWKRRAAARNLLAFGPLVEEVNAVSATKIKQ